MKTLGDLGCIHVRPILYPDCGPCSPAGIADWPISGHPVLTHNGNALGASLICAPPQTMGFRDIKNEQVGCFGDLQVWRAMKLQRQMASSTICKRRKFQVKAICCPSDQ